MNQTEHTIELNHNQMPIKIKEYQILIDCNLMYLSMSRELQNSSIETTEEFRITQICDHARQFASNLVPKVTWVDSQYAIDKNGNESVVMTGVKILRLGWDE